MIQDDQGCADLEFAWNDGQTVDPVAQSGMDDLALRNGSATIDEVRALRGQGSLLDGLGARRWRYSGGPSDAPSGNGAEATAPEARSAAAIRA